MTNDLTTPAGLAAYFQQIQDASQKRHEQHERIKQAAVSYLHHGLAITLCNGKVPLGDAWQDARWSPEDIEKELRSGHNVGVILGPPSKVIDLECDTPAAEDDFRRLFEGCDQPVCPTYKARRGAHRLFAWDDRLHQVAHVPGFGHDRKGGAVVKFGELEVRLGANGRAAQSVLPPSETDGFRREWAPYLSLDDADPPALPDVVIARIIEAAVRAFKPKSPTTKKSGKNLGNRPGDEFNSKGKWEEILSDWTLVQQDGDVCYWRRPGKSEGWSATTGFCTGDSSGDLLYVFSANAKPFEGGCSYSKFAAFALLRHNGEYSEAASDLARQGYGSWTVVSNFDEIDSEKEEGEKIRVPKSMTAIIDELNEITDNWPRRVDTALFVDDDEHGIGWFEKTPDLFGWLKRNCTVRWGNGCGFVTQTELFSELRRTSTKYIGVERFPHEPRIAGHYYLCGNVDTGDGSHLQRLLDRFRPSTPIDRDLIQAALMTLFWGGPVGLRPCFVITSDSGRGAGKSKTAEMIGRVAGGALSFSHNEDVGKIKTRLLSAESLTKRIALLDNVKSLKFSWSELEAMITAPEVGGYRLYVGEGTRPNTLTWFITLNGANLSTDMAQRSVIIKIDRPDRTADWEEQTSQFIADNRAAIMGDVIAILRGEQHPLEQFSRWSTWERDILQRLPNPSEAQRVILDRQATTDVEEEEAGILEGFIEERLRELTYDPDIDRVFIPSPLLGDWFNRCHNDRQRTPAVSAIVNQLITERRLKRLERNKAKTRGRGFVWLGENSGVDDDTKLDIETRIRELREEEIRQREKEKARTWKQIRDEQ